jgi:hypothetical protein
MCEVTTRGMGPPIVISHRPWNSLDGSGTLWTVGWLSGWAWDGQENVKHLVNPLFLQTVSGVSASANAIRKRGIAIAITCTVHV